MQTIDIPIQQGQWLTEALRAQGYRNIPANTIIKKTLPGLGATYGEIKAHRHSIIIEPNVPVILGKTTGKPELLAVWEDCTQAKIKDYLQNNAIQYRKLLTTPESFYKIRKVCNELKINMYRDYFCLFDECEKIVQDIDYRDSINQPINDFFLFEKKAFVSATILNMSHPEFEIQNFRIFEIKPQYDYRKNIDLILTNDYATEVTGKLNELRDSECICVFLNKTDSIDDLIHTLCLDKDSKVFCSDKSVRKLKNKGFENAFSQIELPLAKYNFYTSRFYSAVDIITEHKPHVIVISDAIKAPQTLIEPLLESRQIAGRFRNGISSFTHIAGLDKDIESRSYKEAQTYLKEQRKAYIQLKTLYESATEAGIKQVMKEALERIEISKYMEADNSFNFFMTENLLDSESTKTKYKTWKDFVLSYSFDEEFFEIENQYNHTYSYETERLKIQVNNSLALRKEIVDTFFSMKLNLRINTDKQKQLLEELKRKDEFIVEICQNFDKDFIIANKYKKQPLTFALIKKRANEKALSFPVIEAVLQLFRTDKAYTEKEITNNLTKIYQSFEIDKTPKATDINEYFEISKRRTLKRNGQYMKGYKLLKSKFLSSKDTK
jgi:hypothetical protein